MKTELDFERNASIGFFRNIAILIGFMLLGFALFDNVWLCDVRQARGDRAKQTRLNS